MIDIHSIRQVFNTLPDIDAVGVFLKKVSEAYAERLGVEVFEFVWKTEHLAGGLSWKPIGQHLAANAVSTDFNANWKKGLFYLAYSEGRTVHADDLRALAAGQITFTTEKFTGKTIAKDDYFVGHKSTETEIVVPLKVKEHVVGLINIESYRRYELAAADLAEIEHIADSLARIIDAADYDDQRRREIKRYVEDLKLPRARRSKSCFFARPFRPHFVGIEDALRNAVTPAGATLDLVKPDPANMSIYQDILRQISACAFLIADVTDRNANVLFEAGVAVGADKPVILIEESATANEPLPFDIRNIPVLRYNNITDVTGRTSIELSEPLKECLDRFVDRFIRAVPSETAR